MMKAASRPYSNTTTMSTSIALKWGKQSLNLTVQRGMSGSDVKHQIQDLTNVPPTRQKILCPKLWKGALKDTDIIPDDIPDNTKLTLIGTADTLAEKSIEERPRFVEDMTDEEIWKLKQIAKNGNGVDNNGPIIDIVALQKEHGMDRDDGKMEMYEYNRLVTGLPQQQINDMLVQRMEKEEGGDKKVEQSTNIITELQGELAMTMGLQLRRAYINSLAVLSDGTLISGLDDGHVQFWKRGEMLKDARHTGGCVDEVVVFPSSSGIVAGGGPAFATSGDGSICLWTQDGNHIASLPCFPGTTAASMTVASITIAVEEGSGMHYYYLAACFRITRQTDPNQFRLPPQNEAERRRREAAEMQEEMIQNQLLDVSRRVKVWMYDASQSNNGRVAFHEELIAPHETNVAERLPSTTKLADVNGNLVCGDETGIQIFAATRDRKFQRTSALQFQYLCDIDCMEPLHDDFLAVSISRKSTTEEVSVPSSAVRLQLPTARGVYIVNIESATVRAVLDGHCDSIKCICPLPDGGLLTAGGKFDATVQLWRSETLTKVTKSRDENDEIESFSESKKLKKPGYVFDLKVLPDKNGSAVYAIAAARYNTINIII
jgi:WD40 repeat protein